MSFEKIIAFFSLCSPLSCIWNGTVRNRNSSVNHSFLFDNFDHFYCWRSFYLSKHVANDGICRKNWIRDTFIFFLMQNPEEISEAQFLNIANVNERVRELEKIYWVIILMNFTDGKQCLCQYNKREWVSFKQKLLSEYTVRLLYNVFENERNAANSYTFIS